MKIEIEWIRLRDYETDKWVTLNKAHIVSHGRFSPNGFAVRMVNGTMFLVTQAEYTRFVKRLTK